MNEPKRIPQHVAIIMDGNGRWATRHGKERFEGHIAGVESVRASVRAALRHGIDYLTLYVFSTENWGRPEQEVNALMELFCRSVVNELVNLSQQGVRIRMIGDRNRFSDEVRQALAEAEARTATSDKLTLILALNYSSRDEIVRAVRRIAGRVQTGELGPRNHRRNNPRGITLHGGIPRPRPRYPHERRIPSQQLPAVAVVLCRTMVSGGAVARFHRRVVRQGRRGVRPARTTIRAGQIDEVFAKRMNRFHNKSVIAWSLLLFGILTTNTTAQEAAPTEPADTTAIAEPSFPEDAPMLQYGNRPKRYYIRKVEIHGVKYLDHNNLKSSAGLIEGDSVYLPSDFIANSINRLWRQSVFADVKVGAEIEGDNLDLHVFLKDAPASITGNSKASRKARRKICSKN